MVRVDASTIVACVHDHWRSIPSGVGVDEAMYRGLLRQAVLQVIRLVSYAIATSPGLLVEGYELAPPLKAPAVRAGVADDPAESFVGINVSLHVLNCTLHRERDT